MESTLLIAQLLGLYFIIVGALAIFRRQNLGPAIVEMMKNRAVLTLLAFVELAAGLALVLTQPSILEEWIGIISFIGWTLIVESVIYLAMPMKAVQKFVRRFNKPEWYLGGGVVAIALGAALAGTGFGFFG